MCKNLEKEISNMQIELNKLIETKSLSSSEVLNLSQKLDVLILEFLNSNSDSENSNVTDLNEK
jgi:hypothetical protein